MDLPLPKGGCVTHIFHISDIHIRKGDHKNARSEEYTGVFKRIVSFIQYSPHVNTACVVITGDVFDSKDVINSLGTNLLLSFLSDLSKLLPVYIIKGNHDYKQDQVELPDLLSFLNIVNIPNIVYLDSIGYYYAGDVGFALMPIQHTLSMQCAVGRTEKMPDFPLANQMRKDIKKRIALFHGTVPSHKLTLQWFGDGYDYIMLGDLHIQSIVSNGQANIHDKHIESLREVGKDVYLVNTITKIDSNLALCMYPGSTIQQTFGEDILGHGLLQWDLENDTVSMLHVKNNYGKIYTKCFDDQWKFYVSHFGGKQYIDIKDCAQMKWFPNHLTITVKREGKQFDSMHLLEEELKDYFDPNCIITSNASMESYVDDDNGYINEFALEMKCLSGLNTPTEWKQFIKNRLLEDNVALPWHDWESMIEDPEHLKILFKVPEIQASIDKRNKSIGALIEDYRQVQNQLQSFKPKALKISSVSWDWVLCYGANCSINLDILDNKVVCINAPNGYGKSSCKEIIYIALFGEGFPGRDPKKGLVCQQKPIQEIPKTVIDFYVDATRYKLTRLIRIPPEKGVKPKADSKSIALVEFDGNKIKSTIYGSTVTAWIKKHLGESKEFLASCMLTQDGSNDFFALEPRQQVDKLEKVLNLQSTTIFKNILHEGNLSFKAVKNDLLTVHKVLESQEDFNFDFEHHKNVGTNLEAITSDLHLLIQSITQITNILHGVDKDLLQKGYLILSNLHKEKQCSLDFMRTKTQDLQLEELFHRRGQLESQLQRFNIKSFNKDIDIVKQTLKELPETISHSEIQVSSAQVVSHELIRLETDLYNGCNSINILPNDIHKTHQQFHDQISSLTNTITQLELDNDQLQKKKQVLTTTVDTLLIAAPSKPRQTIEEYNVWNDKIAAFCDQWGTLHVLESKIGALKAFGDISEKQKTIKSWILNAEEISGIKDILKSKDKLDSKVNKLLKERTKQNLVVEHLQDQITSCIHDIDNTDTLMKENQKVLIEHLENRPTSNSKYQGNQLQKQEDYETFLQKYKETLGDTTYIDVDRDTWIVENGLKCLQEYNKVNDVLISNLNLLHSCNHDFNPECTSCQTHPWRVQATRIEQENVQLQKQVCTYSKVMNKFCGRILTDSDINEATKRYVATKEKLVWDEYFQEEAAFATWENEKNTIMMLATELSSKQIIIKKTLKSFQKKLDAAKSNLNSSNIIIENLLKIQNTFTSIQTEHEATKYWHQYIDWKKLQDQEEHWNTEMFMINHYQLWSIECTEAKEELAKCNRELSINVKELQEKKSNLQEKRVQLGICEQLLTCLSNLEHFKKLQTRLELEEYVHAHKIHIELQDTLDAISTIRSIDELKNEVNNIRKALKHLDDYEHLVTIQMEVDDLEKTKNSLLIVKGNLDSNYQKHLVLIEKIQQISDIIQEVEQRSECIRLVEYYFAEFKTWVVEKKAIPMICKHVNSFLTSLCKNHRPLLLTATMLDTSIINWEVIDGNCRPLLQRSSGFQRFAISLAMRVTLSKIGGASIASRQLFIDEGFTACDADNLKSIPMFLDSLLSIYDTILVVTHLEELKENIKDNLCITRDLTKGISILAQ